MKIAVASSGLGHVARGIESWAADLGGALAERGEDVTLFKGDGTANHPYEQVIPCLRRGDERTSRLRKWLPARLSWRLGLGSAYQIEQMSFSSGLIARLRRGRYDILHVQDPLVALAMQRARRVGLLNTRTILMHGTEEPPRFLSKIDHVQQIAPWHFEQAKRAGFAKPGWTAINNFIDTGLFRPGPRDAIRAELGIDPAAPVVLSVAAIKREHKRIDHLIAEFLLLWGDLQGPPPILVVAGGYESETDEIIAEGSSLLGDRVRFLVRFPRHRMPELYRAADIFALASLSEMSPLAVVEAGASGLPCLIHRHPVLEWMIGPGGVAVDMSTRGVLAASIRALVDDEGRRISLGLRAREHSLKLFGRDAVVEQILNYYRSVMATGRGKRPALHGAKMTDEMP